MEAHNGGAASQPRSAAGARQYPHSNTELACYRCHYCNLFSAVQGIAETSKPLKRVQAVRNTWDFWRGTAEVSPKVSVRSYSLGDSLVTVQIRSVEITCDNLEEHADSSVRRVEPHYKVDQDESVMDGVREGIYLAPPDRPPFRMRNQSN